MARRDRPAVPDEDVARALLLSLRYSLDISTIAVATLGAGSASNVDIQVLLTLMTHDGSSSGALARITGMSPADLSRSLRRLQDRGLLARHRAADDRRHVIVRGTDRADRALAQFGARLADHFQAAAPVVKEVADAFGRSPEAGEPITALEAAERLATAGGPAVAALVRAGRPYHVTTRRERHAVISLHVAGPQRPMHLATELRIGRPAATEFMGLLERRRLVTRTSESPDGDRRAVLVALTPRGRRAAARLVAAFAAVASDVVDALLSTAHTSVEVATPVSSRRRPRRRTPPTS